MTGLSHTFWGARTARPFLWTIVALLAVLAPGAPDTALAQGSSTFMQPTVTSDYLRAIRQQRTDFFADDEEDEDEDDRGEPATRRRAEDYARRLFDFSRTEGALPRQYTTYDQINRPSLFPGATSTPQTTLSRWNYEDFSYQNTRPDRRDNTPAQNLATSEDGFNPYEEFLVDTQESPFRTDIFQPGASTGRFGAQTVRLTNRALEEGRLLTQRPGRRLHDNVNLGFVKARVGMIAGISYTDNALFQRDNQISDLVGNIGIRATTRQQITKKNALSFQIGVGYSEYILNPELNDVIRSSGIDLSISPTSRISWETSIGNVFFTFFDAFGVSQRVEDDFLAEEETNFANFTNTFGFATSWQANRTTSITLSLNRRDRIALDPEFSNSDTTSYNLIGDIEYSPDQQWVPGGGDIWIPTAEQSWVAGLSASLSQNLRPGQGQSNSTTTNIGPYFSTALSPFTRIRIAAGLQTGQFEEEGMDDTNLTEPFYSIALTNQLNRFTNQSLRIGHEAGLNDLTNFFVADFIRHSFSFTVGPRTNLSTSVYYEMQEDSEGETQEELLRTGAAINVQHRLNSNVTLFLGYNYGLSDSTLIAGMAGPIQDPNDPTVLRNTPGARVEQETFSFDISFPFARDIDLVLGYRRLRTVSNSDFGGNFTENRGSINFSYNF